MKLRYKRSILGVGWSLLNPLANVLVFRFIFEVVLPVNVPNFTPFLFAGTLVWNWFSMSLMFATTSVVDNRDMIKRPGFPIAILPAVTISSYLIHFLVALPILLTLLVVGGTKVPATIFFLPILAAIQFTITLGLSYFVATLHVAFRDTQYLLGVALQLLFFMSPVFYDVSAVPQRFRFIYDINPIAGLLDGYRAILIRGQIPQLSSLLSLTLVAFLLFSGGYFVYSRASLHFVDEL
jgi:homopolymeric O-antigen transport system permease protein